MSPAPGAVLGGCLPLLPCATADGGRRAVPDPGGPGWSWVAETAVAGPNLRPGRTVADVELSDWGRPGRKHAEAAVAEQLVALCPAVTSHGYAPSKLAHALVPFAEAGLAGMPQVYDSDQSIAPRIFLRRCLDTWHRLGFEHVVPILGLSAGEERVRVWLRECRRLGLACHFWSRARWSSRWSNIVAEEIGDLLVAPAPAGAAP